MTGESAREMEEMKGPVVVTGASGYIGSWLVMRLLQEGYYVRATVRDPMDPKKTKPLLDLQHSDKQLSIWKGDLNEEGSFDEAIQGCTGVFHVSTTMDFESNDPEMYFVSKSLAEKAAWDFSRENNIHLITIIPALVVGPFITSNMPPSLVTALSLITGNEAHYSILKQVQLVHLDDVCEAHIFLFKHPEAEGRYICSSHDATIYDLSRMIKEKYPEYNIPQKFEGIDEKIERVHFSSKKLTGLGFKYRYTMEDMFDAAIQCCREEKLIALETMEIVPEHENGLEEV